MIRTKYLPLSTIRHLTSTGRSNSSHTTPKVLMAFIRDKIRSTGPITVHEYMQIVAGSQVGYYAQQSQQVEPYRSVQNFRNLYSAQ